MGFAASTWPYGPFVALSHKVESALAAGMARRPGGALAQSHLRPTLSQSTSLGSHSVRIRERRRATFVEPHSGHGGAGFVDVERYSSKRVSHCSQRYS